MGVDAIGFDDGIGRSGVAGITYVVSLRTRDIALIGFTAIQAREIPHIIFVDQTLSTNKTSFSMSHVHSSTGRPSAIGLFLGNHSGYQIQCSRLT